MPANPGIEPISNINGAISADHDIGRAKECREFIARLAAETIDAGKSLRRITGHKIKALETKAGPHGLRVITKDRVTRRIRTEQRAAPSWPKRIALIKCDTGRRPCAVNIARRHHARIFLPPLRRHDTLPRATIRPPIASTIAGKETGVAVR